MPAPDIQTLYKFRSTIEPVIRDAPVTAGLPTGNIHISRDGVTLQSPALAVQFQLGASSGHRFNPPTPSYWVFDQWDCAVNLELMTNRTQNSSTAHEDYESLIRLVMADPFSRINPSLNYHAFAEAFRDVSSNYSVDSENNLDISRLSFSSVIAIKRDAWPAS